MRSDCLKNIFLLALVISTISGLAYARSPNSIILSIAKTHPNCSRSNGSIVITASGGTAPYTYKVNFTVQGSGSFINLAAGSYSILVTDALSQSASTNETLINLSTAPSVTAVSVTPSDCVTPNGSLTLTASGGVAPYTYSIDHTNFQSSNYFPNLNSGSYKIAAKGADGCITPYIWYASTLVNQTCAIKPNGLNKSYSCGPFRGHYGLMNVSGGTSPYLYSIDGINFQTSYDFYPLPAGLHTITVKDANGQLMKYTSAVYDDCGPPPLSMTLAVTSAGCNVSNGSITVSPVYGTSPYTYSIDGINFQTGNSFSGLAPGPYTIIVKDYYNVTGSQQTTVYANCLSVTGLGSNSTCGNSNGSIQAQGANGLPPYLFSIDGINFSANTNFINLIAGQYTITIKDAANATNTTTVTVGNTSGPLIDSVTTSPTNCNSNTGTLAIYSHGTNPLSYSLNGITFQPNPVFTGLGNQTYIPVVKDGNGCLVTAASVSIPFQRSEIIDSVTLAATNCNNNSGMLKIHVSGTGSLLYSLDGNNFQSSNQFNGLAKQNYTPVVKNAFGCITTGTTVSIPVDNLIMLVAGSVSPICEGTSVTLPITSDAQNFSWNPLVGLNNPAILNPTAAPAITTTYTVTATKGICSTSTQVTVNVLPAPGANAGGDIEICSGKNALLNGSGGVEYLWSPPIYLNNPALSAPVVVNPPVGLLKYFLSIKDINNCISLKPDTVNVLVTKPEIFAGNDTSILANQPVQLRAVAGSFANFIQYQWLPVTGLNNPSISNPVAIINSDIVYTVEARTVDGCIATDHISLKVFKGVDIYVPTAFTPNNDGRNDHLKAFPVGIKVFQYLKVFDRWGQVVFSTDNKDTGWNGERNGIPQTGTFVWIARGIDFNGKAVNRKGTVTVIR